VAAAAHLGAGPGQRRTGLATDLAAPEIASELFVSVNTIRTHIRHIYAKLGAHCRAEAIERARALGLAAHSLGRPRRSSRRIVGQR
jgi:hypothetical protein